MKSTWKADFAYFPRVENKLDLAITFQSRKWIKSSPGLKMEKLFLEIYMNWRHSMPEEPYETKFKNFIEMCVQTKEKGIDVVFVHHPEVLGDNYSEIIESLNRLSAAELSLRVLPPDQRATSV